MLQLLKLLHEELKDEEAKVQEDQLLTEREELFGL